MYSSWFETYKILKRTMGITVLIAFFVSFVLTDAYAVVDLGDAPVGVTGEEMKQFPSIDPDTFTIPANLGSVRDACKGTSEKTVVHIQDAHCNYPAQRKVFEIIDYINKEHGVSVLNLEGGQGDYDLSIFTGIDDADIKERVADYFMRWGRINGSEYFAINNQDKAILWGVEDAELYVKNLNVYRDSLGYKEKVDEYLKELSYILNNLKMHIYSEELLEFDMKYTQYKAMTLEFKDYLIYLIEKAKQKNIDIEQFSNLRLLSQSLQQEDKIDFIKANKEKEELIDRLREILSKRELEELVTKTVEFRNKMIPQIDFYNYLIKKANQSGVESKDLSELQKYVAYISAYHAVDKSMVMQELGALEGRIKEAMYENDKQEELSFLSKNLILTKNMFDILFMKEDYVYYKANKSGFDVHNFVSFIEKEAPLYKITARPSEDITELDLYREKILEFYEYSFERDKVFLENLKFAGEGARASILVTGGFHTENLCELFKERGISYISILPNFRMEEGYESPYFSILAGGASPIEEAIDSVLSLIQVASLCNQLGIDVQGPEGTQIFRLSVQAVRGILEAARRAEETGEAVQPQGFRLARGEGFIVFSLEGDAIATRIETTLDENLVIGSVELGRTEVAPEEEAPAEPAAPEEETPGRRFAKAWTGYVVGAAIFFLAAGLAATWSAAILGLFVMPIAFVSALGLMGTCLLVRSVYQHVKLGGANIAAAEYTAIYKALEANRTAYRRAVRGGVFTLAPEIYRRARAEALGRNLNETMSRQIGVHEAGHAVVHSILESGRARLAIAAITALPLLFFGPAIFFAVGSAGLAGFIIGIGSLAPTIISYALLTLLRGVLEEIVVLSAEAFISPVVLLLGTLGAARRALTPRARPAREAVRMPRAPVRVPVTVPRLQAPTVPRAPAPAAPAAPVIYNDMNDMVNRLPDAIDARLRALGLSSGDAAMARLIMTRLRDLYQGLDLDAGGHDNYAHALAVTLTKLSMMKPGVDEREVKIAFLAALFRNFMVRISVLSDPTTGMPRRTPAYVPETMWQLMDLFGVSRGLHRGHYRVPYANYDSATPGPTNNLKTVLGNFVRSTFPQDSPAEIFNEVGAMIWRTDSASDVALADDGVRDSAQNARKMAESAIEANPTDAEIDEQIRFFRQHFSNLRAWVAGEVNQGRRSVGWGIRQSDWLNRQEEIETQYLEYLKGITAPGQRSVVHRGARELEVANLSAFYVIGEARMIGNEVVRGSIDERRTNTLWNTYWMHLRPLLVRREAGRVVFNNEVLRILNLLPIEFKGNLTRNIHVLADTATRMANRAAQLRNQQRGVPSYNIPTPAWINTIPTSTMPTGWIDAMQGSNLDWQRMAPNLLPRLGIPVHPGRNLIGNVPGEDGLPLTGFSVIDRGDAVEFSHPEKTITVNKAFDKSGRVFTGSATEVREWLDDFINRREGRHSLTPAELNAVKGIMEKLRKGEITQVVALAAHENVMGGFGTDIEGNSVLYLNEELMGRDNPLAVIGFIHELGEGGLVDLPVDWTVDFGHEHFWPIELIERFPGFELQGQRLGDLLGRGELEGFLHTYLRGVGERVRVAYEALLSDLGAEEVDNLLVRDLILELEKRLERPRTENKLTISEKVLIALNFSQRGERPNPLKGPVSRMDLEGLQGKLDPAANYEFTRQIKGLKEELRRGALNIFILSGYNDATRSWQERFARQDAREHRKEGRDTQLLRFNDLIDFAAKLQQAAAMMETEENRPKAPQAFVLCLTAEEKDLVERYKERLIKEGRADVANRFIIALDDTYPSITEAAKAQVDEIKTIELGTLILNNKRLRDDFKLDANDPDLVSNTRGLLDFLGGNGFIDIIDGLRDKTGDQLADIMRQLFEGVMPLRITRVNWEAISDYVDSMEEVLRAL